MLDIIIDSGLDTLKLLPYLLVTFLLLELIEHKVSKKNQTILSKNKKYGPFIGGILGGLPQCGFSVMGANLYASGVITIGTLIAIFLATSDEMLILMIGEKVLLSEVFRIVGIKVLIGIIVGVVVDILYKSRKEHIHEMCTDEGCHCHSKGIFLSGLVHTLKIGLFIFIANIIIGLIIENVNLEGILRGNNLLTYFMASIIGLIPNCGSSVIITKLYLADIISLGVMLAGLLTGAGVGILVLFRTNKNLKENMLIIGIIYLVGVISGIIIDLI